MEHPMVSFCRLEWIIYQDWANLNSLKTSGSTSRLPLWYTKDRDNYLFSIVTIVQCGPPLLVWTQSLSAARWPHRAGGRVYLHDRSEQMSVCVKLSSTTSFSIIKDFFPSHQENSSGDALNTESWRKCLLCIYCVFISRFYSPQWL